MTYARPTNPTRLTPAEKTDLLTRYADFYRELVAADLGALNRKLPQETFAPVLDRIGALIVEDSRNLATSNADVRQFLEANSLPEGMDTLLPPDFRVFCLLLNAVKQWLAAEQMATDKYLLGAGGRARCRRTLTNCPVTGEPLGSDAELHHPVRDGRPPIPLSRNGHRILEQQTRQPEPVEETEEASSIEDIIRGIKKKNESWTMLRRGCRLLLDLPSGDGTPNNNANAKNFARRALAKTELTAGQILTWMDENGLAMDANAAGEGW